MDPTVYLSESPGAHLPIPQLTTNHPMLLPEIWEEIFLCCNGSLDLRRSNIHRRRGILPLTWVCSHWREMALSFPRLWSRIHICINRRRDYRRDEGLARLLDLWLDRSVPCGLTVACYDLQRGLRDVFKGSVNNIPSRILSESHRWESLYLNVSAAKRSLIRFASVRRNLQSLRYLSITPTRHSRLALSNMDLTIWPSFEPFGECYPQLHGLSLVIGYPFLSSSTSFETLKYLNLMPDRSVHDYALPLQDCVRALAMCPSLVGLRLSCGSIDRDRPLPESVTRPTLRTLEVFWTDSTLPSEVGTFLNLIEVPALRSLSMTTPRSASSSISFWDHDAMKGFLARQRGALETLSLDLPNMHIGLMELIHYLRQSPNIQHINFTLERDPESPIDDETLQKLLVDKDGRKLAVSRRLYYWYPSDHLLTICSFARHNLPVEGTSSGSWPL